MSSFEMTIRKGDKINLENQAFQTEWRGVYLCVSGNLIDSYWNSKKAK